jgi:hypothetical protein
MNELHWLACDKRPDSMLHFARRVVSERTLRLFACACIRHVWPHLICDEAAQHLLQLMESYADGNLTRDEVVVACRPAWEAVGSGFDSSVEGRGQEVAPEVRAAVVASLAQASGYGAASYFTHHCWMRDNALERLQMCSLLREVVGNPFRVLLPRPFPVHVVGLAESCYAAFPAVSTDYAILADALEDLGESKAASHCRESLHVLGCHVIDRVLGLGATAT